MQIDQAKSQRHLSTSEVMAVVEKARRGFKRFKLLPKDNFTSAEFVASGPIKNLRLPPGIKVTSVDYVRGIIRNLSNPIEEMAAMLTKGSAAFSHHFEVECLLRHPRHTTNEPDACGMRLSQGKVFVTYSCSEKNSERREARFAEIISNSMLPARLCEKAQGFSLRHTSSGVLRMPSCEGGDDLNPHEIWCELPGATPREGLALAQLIISGCPITGAEWVVLPDDEAAPMTIKYLATHELRCDEFDINFSYSIRSLDILEELQGVKINSGFFATDIAHFKVGGDDATMSVRTDPAGHKLYVEDIDPYAVVSQLNEKLGVSLVPDDD